MNKHTFSVGSQDHVAQPWTCVRIRRTHNKTENKSDASKSCLFVLHLGPIGAQNSGPFPARSRQKASPECHPPSWDQPRPQSPPGGGLANSRPQDKTQRAGTAVRFCLGRNWEGSKSRGQMNDNGDGIFDDLLLSECDMVSLCFFRACQGPCRRLAP